jgi:YVTN family beta-propeller protein
MKLVRFALILLCSLLVCGLALADAGKAYVSNQDGEVMVIDLATMSPSGSLPIDAKSPRGIGISDDGHWLVTANKDTDNISIIDLTGKGGVRHVKIGKNPEFVRVRGNMAFVTFEPAPSTGGGPDKKTVLKKQHSAAKNDSGDDEDDNDGPGGKAKKAEKKDSEEDTRTPGHISQVDLIRGRVVGDITGKPETEGLEFSLDGKQLLVTNESDNSITVYDIKTRKLLNTVKLATFGNRPRGIKMSPNGQRFAVTLEFSSKLLLLNENLDVLLMANTGAMPYGVAFSPDGSRILVASNRDRLLQVFDAKTLERLKDVPTGERCWHFSYSPDNRSILMACGKSGEIVVLDAEAWQVSSRIADAKNPWGIVTWPKSLGSLDRP